MDKTWVVTYRVKGEFCQKKVAASCIIEAIIRSKIHQMFIIGCVEFVDPCVFMAVDLAKGPDYSTHTIIPNNYNNTLQLAAGAH